MTDRRITIQINADGTAAIRNIRDVTDETRRMGDQTEAAGRRVGAAFQSMASQIGLAIGGGAIAKAYLDANMAADRLLSGLTAVTGSVTASGREMAYITDVANRLGLQVSSAASAYVSLMAATRGTTMEGSRARDIFEAVAIAMAKLGKSSEDTEGALLAIQQMISKGKVSAEELRGQLGERLPGAFQLAASAMNVTTAELDAMLVKGEVIADDLLPKLAARLNDLYDDGSKISGITAEWNRLTTAFQGLAVAIDDATGLTSGLQSALAFLAETTDNIKWAIDYLSKGVNPDRLAPALSVGGFGYENLRQEADRLYSEIISKQQEVVRLSKEMSESSTLSRAFSGLPEMLEKSQGELLGLAQRLGDVKFALSEIDKQQDQTWARQRDRAKAAAEAARDYGEVLTGEAKVVADLEQQYGLLRGQLDAVWQLESSRGKTAGVDSSRMVQDLASAKGAVTEIVGEFQMARATAQGLGADMTTFKGQAEGAAKYLAEAAEKGLSVWEQFAYYHGGPNKAAWGERTKAYADAAVKIVESAGGAMESLSRSTATAIDASQSKIAEALAAAQSQVQGLISQYLPAEAAARRYASAQAALAVAAKSAGLSQAQATEILKKMREETAKSAPEVQRVASVWTKVWETTVQRIDDAFANLWVDLFEGTSNTLETLKRMMLRWLAEIAHMLTTQRLTVAIGAAIGLPGYAAAAGAGGAGAAGGGGISGLLSGVGSWFGGTSMGLSAARAVAWGAGSLGISGNWLGAGVSNLAMTPNWAMGIGGIGGLLAGSLLGNGSVGSQIGTTIGTTAGTIIGSMIFPGIGTILGGIIGGGGGGFLGKLFGGKKEKKPNPWAAIDVVGGDFRLLNSNEMDAGAINGVLNQVNQQMDQVAKMLGSAAIEWQKSYNHLSFHLTSDEAIESMIKNLVQWQVTHMIEAMRNDEVARAGSKLLGDMIMAAVSDAGDDPQAVIAAVQMAKTMYKNLMLYVDRLFVFSADGAMFSSIDQAAQSLWDLAQSMKESGESAVDALTRIMAAMSNLTVTNTLNPSLSNLTLTDEDLAELTKTTFSYLDDNVAKAERDLAAAMAGTMPSVPIIWSLQAPITGDWSEGVTNIRPPLLYTRQRMIDQAKAERDLAAAMAGTMQSVPITWSLQAPITGDWSEGVTTIRPPLSYTRQRMIDQAEIAAARERLKAAQELASITERVLTEEQIQAEIMRRRIEIMERIQELAGGADQLAALQASYFEYAFSEAERVQMATEFAMGKITDFNASLGLAGASAIDTIGELRAYIETLDLTTDEGQKAYVEALRVVEWLKMLDNALGSVRVTIQEAVRQTKPISGVSEFERAMALRNLQRWADRGQLPSQQALERTLDILSRVTDQDFRTKTQRDIAAAKQYAALLKLENVGKDILDPKSKELNYLRRTAESADQQLIHLASIDAALNDSGGSGGASGSRQALSAQGTSQDTLSQESSAASLLREIQQMRDDLSQLTAAQLMPMKDIRDLFQRWEIDGLPPTRDDEELQTIAVLKVA